MTFATEQGPHDDGAVWELPDRLGLTTDIRCLNEVISTWADGVDDEILPMVQRQLAGRAKRYRPATVFSCYRATAPGGPPEVVVRSAAAIELLHNVSLVIDDILDRSRYR